MKVAYFDCFSGLAGDMILGALLDLGLDIKILKQEIEKLDIKGYSINTKKVTSHGLKGTDVDIKICENQPHRTLKDINLLIDESNLKLSVKKISNKIFYNLAIAESKVHKIPVEKIHFHEVGAIDSIIDIVGSSIGIHELRIDEIISSPLPQGNGFVKCEHGIIPVPAPATLELTKNIPAYKTNRQQELVTPTGAAFITTLAEKFGESPLLKHKKIGYGSGKTKSEYPSMLKITIGDKT